VNHSYDDDKLTLPSDPSGRQNPNDGYMSSSTFTEFGPGFITTQPSRNPPRFIRHSRAIYAISGAAFTWVYLVLLLVLLPVALSLVVVWVGVPMLIGILAAVRGCAAIERRMANALLGVDIKTPPRIADLKATPMGQLRSIVTHGATWRSVGYAFIRFITGMVMFVVVTAFGATSIAFITAPFFPDHITINDWHPIGGWASFWAPPLGLLIGAIGWYLSSVIGMFHGWIAPVLLGPSEGDRVRVLEGRTAKLSAQTQLARELHDSVGHTMTSVVVQAGAAKRVFDSNPQFAREALGEIETSARQALDELDYMISMLRSDQPSAARSPLPTLADTGRLIEVAKRNGLVVAHTLSGDPSTVPMHLSRESYRIIQEGLTNATKHAPNSTTTLTVDIAIQQITIEVINPMPRTHMNSIHSTGRGLQGINERVQAMGGVVWVGPVEDTHVLRVVMPFHVTEH
jgi:signal transduction histidine kinase